MNIRFLKTEKINLIYLLSTLVIVTSILNSWFSEGKVISNNSEENLNILNPQKTAEYYSTIWYYPYGTGLKSAPYLTRYPTFTLLSLLQKAGLPSFTIQAFLIGTIMTIGILSMYLLLRKGFSTQAQVAIVGSFFYTLNLYSMTQVWKRFLYNGMFAWAYLPLFVFFWIKLLSEGYFKWLILFLISSVIFSYAFSHPAYLITFWATGGIFVIVETWRNKENKGKILMLFIKSVLAFTAWILVNIWWIYPLLISGESYIAESISQWQANLNSLWGVSHYFNTFDILLLRQRWYFGKHMDWSAFYNNPLIFLISIGILIIVLTGLIKSKRQKYWPYLISLFTVGWFISKGTSQPLGYSFYYWLFSIFPQTGALRNSYEKFGIVWLLPYSIFFAVGLLFIYSVLRKKLKLPFLGLTILLSFGILIYPMWNGDLFPPKHRLQVPIYYTEANEYLKLRSNNRVFHIPFLTELEVLEYNWGYRGEDPSENLFDLEPVTKPKTPVYSSLYELLPKFLPDKHFPKILGLLGVENVILHKDSVYPKIDLAEISGSINNWEGVQEKKEIGQLVIYSLNKELVRQRIYTATSLVPVQSIEEGLTNVVEGLINLGKTIFVTEGFTQVPLTESSDTPKVTFQKVSNVHYQVRVEDTISPFVLVLNNTFDKLWQARIDGLVVSNHFLINGFANGWLIDRKGNYKIDVLLKVWPWE